MPVRRSHVHDGCVILPRGLFVVQVLRDHRKQQAEERLKVGPEWRGTDIFARAVAVAT